MGIKLNLKPVIRGIEKISRKENFLPSVWNLKKEFSANGLFPALGFLALSL
jgi:hypothetical protein